MATNWCCLETAFAQQTSWWDIPGFGLGDPGGARKVFGQFFTADIPESEVGATNLDESGGSEGENLGEISVKFSGHFHASFAVQTDPPNFSQNSSKFITPCLVAEASKLHLPELLAFGGRKMFGPSTLSGIMTSFIMTQHVA